MLSMKELDRAGFGRDERVPSSLADAAKTRIADSSAPQLPTRAGQHRRHTGGRMTGFLKRFMDDESGQGLVEYVLIIACVAIGLVAVMFIFRDQIGTTFDTITDALQDAPADPYASSNAPG